MYRTKRSRVAKDCFWHTRSTRVEGDDEALRRRFVLQQRPSNIPVLVLRFSQNVLLTVTGLWSAPGLAQVRHGNFNLSGTAIQYGHSVILWRRWSRTRKLCIWSVAFILQLRDTLTIQITTIFTLYSDSLFE